MSISFTLGLLVVGVWSYLLAFRGGYWRARHDDAQRFPTPLQWPEIAVIIPARNEAEVLGECLPSLLKSGYPGMLRVVLVDDRSDDGTAHIAQQLAQQSHATDRLEVVRAPALADGWKGKVAAMHAGLNHVSSRANKPEYVLFTDADIAYDAGSIAPLVAQSLANQLVLNSRMVKLRCESTAERLLIPAFVYFFRMLYPFAWVNNPRRTLAAAAGGCMLVHYETLIKAGGVAPIRGALIDDCALGRLMKAQGPVHVALTQSIHSRRAYPGLGDIHAMVTRTAYDQLAYSPWQLAGAVAGMVLTYLAPLWLLFATGGAAHACGALACVLMMGSFIPMQHFYGQARWRCVALPLIALCYMGFTIDSAILYYRGRGGLWKGRAQAGSAVA